jgi:hypothetical protein
MFVDVVYPGWVPFDGLGGAENIIGFIETADMMINNYNFDKFEAGPLTRLGIVEDNRTHQQSYKICRQHLNRFVKMLYLEILH